MLTVDRCPIRYIFFGGLVGLTCLLLCLSPARALEIGGLRLPDSTMQNGERLLLNGAAVRKVTFFGLRVYVIGLYLEALSDDADHIISSEQEKRIVMRFMRSVDTDRLRKGWINGFKKNSKNFAGLTDKIELMNQAMRDVVEGDSIVFEFSGQAVTVTFNQQDSITVTGTEFQKGLLRIWLGPHPPDEEMKKGLLSEGVRLAP